jgi:hypothetical protein
MKREIWIQTSNRENENTTMKAEIKMIHLPPQEARKQAWNRFSLTASEGLLNSRMMIQ